MTGGAGATVGAGVALPCGAGAVLLGAGAPLVADGGAGPRGAPERCGRRGLRRRRRRAAGRAAGRRRPPLVPGWVGESCSRQLRRPRVALAQRRLDRRAEGGRLLLDVGRDLAQRAAIDGDGVVAGLDRRVGAVVVVDLLGVARQLRRGPGGQRGEQGARHHEGPRQADEHRERVPTGWYHSRPHEAPRHRRRRLHRVDRRRPAASPRATTSRCSTTSTAATRRRSPRAPAISTSPSTTPRPPRPRVAEGFDAVLHFAALALVAESVEHPERYHRGNFVATLNLLDAMRDGRRQAARVLLDLRRLRRAGRGPDARDAAGQPGQRLRQLEARGRPDDLRRVPRARARRGLAALLQRRGRERRARRGPRARDAPDPARPAGRRRARASTSRSSARTTRPRTAPRSATTSTSRTSARPTSSGSSARRTRVSTGSTTSATARASRCAR